MARESIPPELGFFKDIFPPDGWGIYARRIRRLSSSNPEHWQGIDFPVEIALELTNYCNLRCVMCPTPFLKRARGYMDEILFKRVAWDVSNEKGFLFLPQGFGELLLHRKWFELLDFAFKSGIRPIVVLSNGMLLHEANLDRLLNRADVIIVTIDWVTQKTYGAIRLGGSLRTVTENIKTFLGMRGQDRNPRLVLRMIRMKDTEREIEGFKDYWSNRIGKGDIIQIAEYNNWAGKVRYSGMKESLTNRKRYPFKMLWKNLTLYHNGDVSPCCYDGEGELIIGNALNHSLKEIWNGAHLRNLRNLHLDYQFKKIPICSNCNSWF